MEMMGGGRRNLVQRHARYKVERLINSSLPTSVVLSPAGVAVTGREGSALHHCHVSLTSRASSVSHHAAAPPP